MVSPIPCRSPSRALRSIFAITKTHDITLPIFLVPALSHVPPRSARPHFSTTAHRRSKLGVMPLSLPPEVTLTIREPSPPKPGRAVTRNKPTPTVEIEGPLGKITMPIPPCVIIDSDESRRTHVVSIHDSKDKKQKAMWGTTRQYLRNHILGVSEGHTAILRLIGVGYRASIENTAITKNPEYEGQQFVSLKVGYSHPIELGVPRGVKASCPQPARILLEGVDKVVVKQFAADIRKWRVPEPYKGKGIFVNDEVVRLKNKKIK